MFELKKPCAGCPFLKADTGVRGLRPGRIESIVNSDPGFPCHQTCEGTAITSNPKEQQCAGFLIFHLVNESAPNLMRMAGRMNMIQEVELLTHEHEVFTNLDELIAAHQYHDKEV